MVLLDTLTMPQQVEPFQTIVLDEALRRIMVGRPQLKWYEAGMDLGLSPDPYESFRLFQKRILAQYAQMADEFGLTAIDATLPLVQQQQQVRTLLMPHLKGLLKANYSPWQDALTREGLHGRYLTRRNPVTATEA